MLAGENIGELSCLDYLEEKTLANGQIAAIIYGFVSFQGAVGIVRNLTQIVIMAIAS